VSALQTSADAAETIQPRNSLEKMLAHGAAALHSQGMRMLARMDEEMHRAAMLD
jgi:hypothetical protein